MKFALFGNTYQAKKSAHVERLLSILSQHNAEVHICREFYQFLTNDLKISIRHAGVFDGNNFEADMILSIGGDGTFLKAASRVGSRNIPILGINTGRLGFLADVSPEEIAVLKRDSSSMISIHTAINGAYLTTYQADGLVIATPTGSTAYSLSIGGPVIVPHSNTIAITPVAPHSLNVRPIVINDDWEITLDIESRSHNFLIAIDGRSETCREGSRLTIRKADYKINVVKRNSHIFFNTLRNKMMWGADGRG